MSRKIINHTHFKRYQLFDTMHSKALVVINRTTILLSKLLDKYIECNQNRISHTHLYPVF